MDDFDRKLLEIVQDDCTLSDSEMGRRVSLSASAVRRRLAAMRRSGVIAAEVAVLGSVAQTGITVITSVAFERETPTVYDDFRNRMKADPHVLQCYSVAGQADFFLVVAASSLEAYEAWGEQVLLSDPAIRRYDSYVAWSTTKFTTRRPVF
ncbi:asnC family protein [Asticcacaulis biprosthecium C19]|uniref:AsnC family protein n=1 Tax=Asticcacaulis biprosthecium C19 TaxID=715226 RepID=F4QHI2_9CAUL|nr:Lrp/AsnC family transcriptional regulator [Asticcacaulis biprosthecium]EGF92719.1 asnC family protein [Asticcacaulis biprosthecium C19]